MRHFSQTPSCQAQVIHNVNAGIRAFLVGGGKARFDGFDPVTGGKRFRNVTTTENEVLDRFDRHFSGAAKGTNLEFRLSPTITALLPSSTSQTLGSLDMLDALSIDFAHAVKDLSLTLSDLRRLSSLGSLPVHFKCTQKGPIINVRFPGCDAEVVARLCEEMGVFRGIVCEDEGWQCEKDVEMALLFPFAPTTQNGSEYFEHQATVDTVIAPEQVEWQGMISTGLPSHDFLESYEDVDHPMTTPIYGLPLHSDFESLTESDFTGDDPYLHLQSPHSQHSSLEDQQQNHTYEGLEGIYRFIQECDHARR